MIPDEAWNLVPKERPADVEPWIVRFAEAAKFEEREERSYIWAMYLLSQLTGQALSTAITGVLRPNDFGRNLQLMDITAGFIQLAGRNESGRRSLREARIDPKMPLADGGDTRYTFGVLIGIEPPEGFEENTGEEGQTPSQFVSIANFPVVVEYRRINYSAPLNPIGATATCYAKPRASKRYWGPAWSDGIVIARHSLKSLGFATGISVPMSGGNWFTVVDIDSGTTIDAAIVDCLLVPASASALSLAPGVAPGMKVDIRTASHTFSADVLLVNDHPTYYGSLMAHRFFLNGVGVTGDSGSLVTTSGHGDSVGLYIGSTGGSKPEGLVQSMRQIVHYFDVDLFD
jgi:hypothetical protein